MSHLMLDFETLGTNPNAVVLSLGAVIFDAKEIKKSHYWTFNIEEQIKGGRSVSPDTVMWWIGRGDKAKEVFKQCKELGISLEHFVGEFAQFLSQEVDLKVWGNAATFDVTIIEDILELMGQPLPWKYFNQRCYRTAKLYFDHKIAFEGTQHNALDDAKFQAKNLIEHWKANPTREK